MEPRVSEDIHEQAAERVIAWAEAERNRFKIDRETMELVFDVEPPEMPEVEDFLLAWMDDDTRRRVKHAMGVTESYGFG